MHLCIPLVALVLPAPGLANFHIGRAKKENNPVLPNDPIIRWTDYTACPSNYYGCKCFGHINANADRGVETLDGKAPSGNFSLKTGLCGMKQLNFYYIQSKNKWQFYENNGDGKVKGECFRNSASSLCSLTTGTAVTVIYDDMLVCYSYICEPNRAGEPTQSEEFIPAEEPIPAEEADVISGVRAAERSWSGCQMSLKSTVLKTISSAKSTIATRPNSSTISFSSSTAYIKVSISASSGVRSRVSSLPAPSRVSNQRSGLEATAECSPNGRRNWIKTAASSIGRLQKHRFRSRRAIGLLPPRMAAVSCEKITIHAAVSSGTTVQK